MSEYICDSWIFKSVVCALLMAMEGVIKGVEEIVGLTSKLSVENEEDWVDESVKDLDLGEQAVVGCIVS